MTEVTSEVHTAIPLSMAFSIYLDFFYFINISAFCFLKCAIYMEGIG